MADPLVCADCGQNYVMTASEKVRFQELIKNVQGFHMPKRCPECRRRRRTDRVPQKPAIATQVAPVAKVSIVGVTPAEVAVAVTPPKAKPEIAPPPSPAPPVLRAIPEESSEAPREEVRFILATKDFEDLVHGRPIVWQGVRVILADIGFKVMRDAIERAETERAKIAFRKNGSV